MLIRCIGIIEAVLQKLNPKISLFRVLVRSEESKFEDLLDSNKVKKKSMDVLKSAHDLVTIPNEVASFLKSVNNGDAKFKIELSDSSKHVDKLENLVHEIVLGFVDGCLIIGCVVTNDELIKGIFFGAAVIVSIWLLIKMIIDIIHRGY